VVGMEVADPHDPNLFRLDLHLRELEEIGLGDAVYSSLPSFITRRLITRRTWACWGVPVCCR